MIFTDVRKADTVARGILSKIKTKYPRLDAYLVYSSRLGQASLGGGSKEVFAIFPSMFLDSAGKTKALRILKEKKDLENEKKDCRALEVQLEGITSELAVDNAVHVALRFGELCYDLVRELQVDELIDTKLTPQSRASIQIVLGTIGDLSERAH